LGFQAESFAQAPKSEQVQPAPDANACRLEIRVVDLAGAAIPGAHVSVQPEQVQSVSKAGATGSDGVFSDSIWPGRYSLNVQSPGFQPYTKQDVDVACGSQAPVSIDVQLQIGLMGEVVVINGHVNPVHRAWNNTTFFLRRLLHLA
jgi:hypothetical protein